MKLNEFRQMSHDDQLAYVQNDPDGTTAMLRENTLGDAQLEIVNLMIKIDPDDSTVGNVMRQLWPLIYNRIKLGDMFAKMITDQHKGHDHAQPPWPTMPMRQTSEPRDTPPLF